MPNALEVNCKTGEITERDFTPDELLARQPKLEDTQQYKIAELYTTCNTFILAGFNSISTGHTFSFDTEYQSNFNQKATMLSLDPSITTVYFNTKDAGLQQFTREQFVQICKEAEAHKEGLIIHYLTLKQQVLNATTIEAVNAFAW